MIAAWPSMPGCLVDLGGDIAVWGEPPDRGTWRIAVADPRHGGRLSVLSLRAGGVATSGRDRRRFGLDGELHHLIDPATGEPAVPGPLAVTVVAPDAASRGGPRHRARDHPGRRVVRYVAARPHIAALVVPAAGAPFIARRPSDRRARMGPGRGVMSAAAALPVAWLVARAAGLVAFGILTLSTWLGLGMSTRLLGPKFQSRLLGWHRTLAWTGLAMVGLHVGALLLDPVMHFGPAAVLVPFASPFRPAAVAAGVVAGWLMLTLTLSFRMRRWIGQRGWRRLHYASFGAFVLALIHALASGTDTAGVGGPILALVAGGPVLWLVLVRMLSPGIRRTPVARPSPTT